MQGSSQEGASFVGVCLHLQGWIQMVQTDIDVSFGENVGLFNLVVETVLPVRYFVPDHTCLET